MTELTTELKAEFLSGTVRWEQAQAVRYYEVTLQRNLFGQWELLCVWGGIGSPRGGHQCRPVHDQVKGAELLRSVALRRERRGYARCGR